MRSQAVEGTRLKMRFETYGSLVDEFGTLTTDSLRLPDVADDPILFPRPPMPEPDAKAPERSRWMQALMIPWLWQDRLDIPRLIGWLQGSGLPPVGHEEEPYHWLLRGISIPGEARDYLERRFAERLAIVLGEQPDVHPLVDSDPDEFLLNLYWTCAGLVRPGFLAEQLWRAYKRLKGSKLSGAVRDALQGALVHNQFGETKPLKELWTPMVEKGRHSWLRGDETVGYEGILLRHRTIKADLDSVLWALGKISHRWNEQRTAGFQKLVWQVPDLDKYEVCRMLVESANHPHAGWPEWARQILPIVSYRHPSGEALEISVRFQGSEFYAVWPVGQRPTTGFRKEGSSQERSVQQSALSGSPQRILLLNELLTRIGDSEEASLQERQIAHALVFNHMVKMRRLRDVKHRSGAAPEEGRLAETQNEVEWQTGPGPEANAALIVTALLGGVVYSPTA